MESTTNSIRFAIAVLMLFTLLAIAAGMIIPFTVDQSAAVQVLAGDVTVQIGSDAPDPVLPGQQINLKPGQTVRLQPGSEAVITFTINKGRVHLTGPATFTLVESYRRATSLGHTLDSLSRDYDLTIEQTQGTARYNFANTSPALDELQVTIQLPDGNYRPADPCWTITVNTAGQSTIERALCP